MKDKVTPQINLEKPQGAQGLTSSAVSARVSARLVNGDVRVQTKSYGKIFVTNTFTLFNILNVVLAILVCVLGHSPKNATFIGPAVLNWIIGIVQEIRAKHTIDKLSLISAPKVTVLRDEEEKEIAVSEIVMDDLTILAQGKQICADAVIVEGSCEVNESLITGESDPVVKGEGDELLSGSFIVAGKVKARVVHLGADNYANKISAGAKYIKSSNSEILRALRMVIRIMSFVVVPLGVLLFLKQYLIIKMPLDASIVKMVGSMSSMIPQGLMALSSAVFAVGVIRLSKHKTLSQDLYCIETLARVDVLCLDKTGTITEGSMEVKWIVPKGETDQAVIDKGLVSITHLLPDGNPTFVAIKDYYKEHPVPSGQADAIVPFNSARKWSGVSVDGTTYVMGAAEFVLGEGIEEIREELEDYSQKGYRVLVLTMGHKKLEDNALPDDLTLAALVLISDKIRAEAPATLRYFAEENVDIRVISGDNPVTVAAIAKQAGLENCTAVDMSTVADEDIQEASRTYKVFGRVTPEQKLKLVQALKADKHTVAMTGDGVNDVLALKEADCSIAMASGSDAARNVAQLVLLDSNFASMPHIVAEGRRSINNLQRSSALYLVKTIYSMLLAFLFLFFKEYPFEPTNLTLVGMATIGIPSVFLALEPNKERVKGHFLQNALSASAPGALAIVLSVAFLQLLLVTLPQAYKLDSAGMTTVSVIVLAAGAFMVLFRVSMPMNWKHIILFVTMLAIFMVGWYLSSVTLKFGDKVVDLHKVNLFSMTPMDQLTAPMGVYIGAGVGLGIILFAIFTVFATQIGNWMSRRLMKTLRLEDKA